MSVRQVVEVVQTVSRIEYLNYKHEYLNYKCISITVRSILSVSEHIYTVPELQAYTCR